MSDSLIFVDTRASTRYRCTTSVDGCMLRRKLRLRLSLRLRRERLRCHARLRLAVQHEIAVIVRAAVRRRDGGIGTRCDTLSLADANLLGQRIGLDRRVKVHIGRFRERRLCGLDELFLGTLAHSLQGVEIKACFLFAKQVGSSSALLWEWRGRLCDTSFASPNAGHFRGR